MRVLLTGSSGYVGSVTRNVLEAAGHDVVGLDTALYEGCDLGGIEATPPPDLALDLRDVEEEHLDGFDAVVHLAALSNDPVGDLDGALTFVINYEASVRLAELARAKTEFNALRDLAPELVEARLAGQWMSTIPEFRRRATTFLRIAAGLEDPSAAEALR